MRVSQIGLISTKIKNNDEKFPVQDMLIQTGQLEQYGSGIFAYGHIPCLVKEKIQNIISSVFKKYDCSKLELPLLQPETIWESSGRLERYVNDGVMFRVLTEKGNYCLAPTAEEAVVVYANARLQSYKQLPATYFQIGQKFRNELRARGTLLRGKSFEMLDAYSFGRNQKDLDEEYERIKKAYFEIFEALGLKTQPVGADSGSIGGNKSEEFMCISEIGEDDILLDEESGKAFNCELLERKDYKEYLKENYGITNIEKLKKQKAVELGHIFQLGDKYAKSMNATYVDENGKNQYFVMGCYGIGVSRTLAMVYENSIIKDEKGNMSGICLPFNVNPYIIYIIPKLDDEGKKSISEDIYAKLLNNNVSVLYDDRKEVSIGAKIKDSKMVGVKYTAVLGKTLDQNVIEVENNANGEKTTLSFDEFISFFTKLEQKRIY